MSSIIKIDGKDYVRIGDKLAEIDHFDVDGKPVLKTWSEETPNAAGGMDCTVHVECLQIAAKSQNQCKVERR